jgi:Ca-activated chloride channel family protein
VFEFDLPWMFLLLPAPLIAIWLLPAYRERRESVRVPFFEGVAAAAGVKPGRGGALMRRNLLQKIAAPLAWALIVTAAARPQYVEPPIEKIESARDLMLAVDLSGSMDTRDMFDPEGNRVQRLDAVKLVLDDFIARRVGDRIGIIVFGSQAFVQTPFTQDHELVRALLDQTQPRMAGPQTMLGDAIGLTIKVFEESEARDRVLVLLTDGNDTGSKVPPHKAAEIAADNDVTIHTVAVGDPRTVGEGAMDLEVLEAISRVTGGTAFNAGNREQLDDIYREIDALTPEEIQTIAYRPTRELFHWPLGGAVVLVLLFQLLMGLGVALQARGGHQQVNSEQ